MVASETWVCAHWQLTLETPEDSPTPPGLFTAAYNTIRFYTLAAPLFLRVPPNFVATNWCYNIVSLRFTSHWPMTLSCMLKNRKCCLQQLLSAICCLQVCCCAQWDNRNSWKTHCIWQIWSAYSIFDHMLIHVHVHVHTLHRASTIQQPMAKKGVLAKCSLLQLKIIRI